jgi:hypothetical protein
MWIAVLALAGRIRNEISYWNYSLCDRRDADSLLLQSLVPEAGRCGDVRVRDHLRELTHGEGLHRDQELGGRRPVGGRNRTHCEQYGGGLVLRSCQLVEGTRSVSVQHRWNYRQVDPLSTGRALLGDELARHRASQPVSTSVSPIMIECRSARRIGVGQDARFCQFSSGQCSISLVP